MSKHNKDKRINARVTQAHYDKLMDILKSRGMSFSSWIREKIEQSRLK